MIDSKGGDEFLSPLVLLFFSSAPAGLGEGRFLAGGGSTLGEGASVLIVVFAVVVVSVAVVVEVSVLTVVVKRRVEGKGRLLEATNRCGLFVAEVGMREVRDAF